MSLFLETLITLFIAVVIIAAVWFFYGRFVTPVKAGKGERICALIYARDSTPDLSRTVNSLIWLMNSGRIDMDIVIADGGMDADSRRMAELLTKGYETVRLCKAAELEGILAKETEEEWRRRNLTR